MGQVSAPVDLQTIAFQIPLSVDLLHGKATPSQPLLWLHMLLFHIIIQPCFLVFHLYERRSTCVAQP